MDESRLTNKKIVFNYFSGNIKFIVPLGTVTLDEFIKAHKNPSPNTWDVMAKIQVALANGDIKLKRELKHKLYSFVPAALFKVGWGRKYANIDRYAGLMQLDFDAIETVEKAHELKEYLFTTYQCVVCAYLSPSKRGVKALIRITRPRDKEHYQAIYKTVEKEFEQLGYFDTATKNIVLPLFLSIDKEIYSRDFSEAVAWDKEDWAEPKRNTSSPTNLTFPSQRFETKEVYFYEKTVRLFKKKIESIDGAGHPQVRSACLVLGSRVGAGYITRSEAEFLAEVLISGNEYLNKNTDCYIKTAMWCINEGISNPKEY